MTDEIVVNEPTPAYPSEEETHMPQGDARKNVALAFDQRSNNMTVHGYGQLPASGIEIRPSIAGGRELVVRIPMSAVQVNVL